MKVLQINVTVNTGSTGRIAEDIGSILINENHESYIAFGQGNRPSKSEKIKIGNQFDLYRHGINTLLFDRHGFGSFNATQKLIKRIESIKPDVIGLHNLHGYYINIKLLFEYLSKSKIPILWTLYDCWSFTGHCTYFDDINCEKWKIQCNSCPKTHRYPRSLIIDNSRLNYIDKKRLFGLPDNLDIVVHSDWLKRNVEDSFLKSRKIHQIPSGIDIELFKPQTRDLNDPKVILGVASTWNKRKGLSDFIKLSHLLGHDYQIVLIGLSKQQIRELPINIRGIYRTENIEELTIWYSKALVFINPTYQDNFPTTNIEALACGTPVITYNTGGSPEAINENTGRVVNKGNIQGLRDAIQELEALPQEQLRNDCRARAEKYFDKNNRYQDYLNLYEQILNEKRI